jgi:hypothetical protein
MAAFGASAVTATEKRGRQATSYPDMLTTSTRVFSFVIPASSTVGNVNLTNLKLGPGTILLGGTVKPSATLGSSTLAFTTVTSNVIFSAATAYTAEAAITNTIPLMVPSSATADDTINVALATATSPASDITVTVSLVIAQVGVESAQYTTYTV